MMGLVVSPKVEFILKVVEVQGDVISDVSSRNHGHSYTTVAIVNQRCHLTNNKGELKKTHVGRHVENFNSI